MIYRKNTKSELLPKNVTEQNWETYKWPLHKHAGELLGDIILVDRTYIEWCLQNIKGLTTNCRKALKSKKHYVNNPTRSLF